MAGSVLYNAGPLRLIPYPFGRLVTRALREVDRRQAIFDLPLRHGFFGDPAKDLSVSFHDTTAATPLGPAAGPQSQMAQNIVLAWLGGSRIIELKTVQVLDELEIPRPCIDVRNVGFNVEWSQELKLEQSLEEYVKASMLIEILVASGRLPLAPGFERTVFDMSVGYDLAGIRGERVGAFLRGMLDAIEIVDRLRAQIPDEYRVFRDLDFSTRISNTLTLSTFHGCPAGEIESIIEFLLERFGLHCVVKLNPTLLGAREARRLLHDVLDYDGLRVPDRAFEEDTTEEQAVGFVDRLMTKAEALGLGFGVKLTNTLIVENNRGFFPDGVREMYLSGQPLHVLAMHLVRRFRRAFGARLPVSFSAGIDRANFADAVALGLVPVTVCTDLLRPGGYGRQRLYFRELVGRMDAVGARTIAEFVANAYGHGASPDVTVRNTETYVACLDHDERYRQPTNAGTPKKIGSQLALFDCITCDLCVPVCPNDANFTFTLPQMEIPVVKLLPTDGGFEAREGGVLRFAERHQIGNVADFCNDCGNCDVFCPEDGGPYVVKPRFFVERAAWGASPDHDGFFVARNDTTEHVLARIGGRAFELVVLGTRVTFRGEGFDVEFDENDAAGTVAGSATNEIDLTYFEIMNRIRKAILAADAINYLAI